MRANRRSVSPIESEIRNYRYATRDPLRELTRRGSSLLVPSGLRDKIMRVGDGYPCISILYFCNVILYGVSLQQVGNFN